MAKGNEKKAQEVKAQREPRWYSAEDIARPAPSRKNKHNAPRLRKSLTPGTIVIILAGRFRGKRAVFLKQLPSGLLLVSGPYKVNGVPLRRLNARYVIATSTKVDVSKTDVSKINDAFFARETENKPKKADGEFFEADKKKTGPNASRKAAQSSVDGALLPVIEKVPNLRAYLSAKFSLTRGQKPHEMKF